MFRDNLFKIVIMSVILFLLVNFFIGGNHMKTVISDIILRQKGMDESENDYVYELEKSKSKYLSERFRIYFKRSIFFGIAITIGIIFITKEKKIGGANKENYFEPPPF
jgi:hypothetical protein